MPLDNYKLKKTIRRSHMSPSTCTRCGHDVVYHKPWINYSTGVMGRSYCTKKGCSCRRFSYDMDLALASMKSGRK